MNKTEVDNRTVSTIAVLSEEQRLEQIASMMSGKGMSTMALAAAAELINHFQ